MDKVPQSAIEHARQYPFAIPRHSYLYLDGRDWKLDLGAGGDLRHATIHGATGKASLSDIVESAGQDQYTLYGKRVAVLSLGSNSSPGQLSRKFADLAGHILIAVIRGQLMNFDVGYSAHITRYGSIPAALAASPGTQVEIFINVLDPAQLEVMHRTESLGQNYAFSRLQGVELKLDGGRTLDSIYFYRSRYGLLQDQGQPIALSAIAARNRVFPALNESEVLDWVHQRISPNTESNAFIAANIASPELRQQHVSALEAFSAPPDYACQDILG